MLLPDTAAARPSTALAPSAPRALAGLAPGLLALLVPAEVWLAHALLAAAPLAAFPTAARAGAGAALALVLAAPLAGLASALASRQAPLTARAVAHRRLAHLAFASPALLPLTGMVAALAGLPPALPWVALFGAAVLLAARSRPTPAAAPARGPLALRLVHGGAAAALVLFVAAHLANHLVAWWGQPAHQAVLEALRTVYRAPVVEPLLVGTVLLQVVTGLLLARAPHGTGTVRPLLQSLTGGALGAFLVSHGLAVFILGRRVLAVDTNWSFATGGAGGLTASASSLALVPYYFWAVAVVVAHAALGAGAVWSEHGGRPAAVRRLAVAGAFAGVALALALTAALLGARLA